MNKENEPGQEPGCEPDDETLRLMKVLDYAFFNLAHELGNPINSIKMTLDVLINNFADYPRQTQLDYLRNLQFEFTRLEELLKALRSFNAFESLAIRPTDIKELLGNLLQMLEGEVASKGITLVYAPPSAPVRGLCDPRALQQVLLQVMSNAIDALAGGSGPQIGMQVAVAGGKCLIRVKDNGGGIPPGKQGDLFKPFFSCKTNGVGLGLLLAKKLLAQMNGTIAIESMPGQGTIVAMTLPQAIDHG